MPSIALCTIALNEMEWLPHLYQQHKDWPELVKWVFVEGADAVYARTNPSLVDEDGLSVDGTSAYLRQLSQRDDRVTYIPHGLSSNPDKSLGKVELRQRYLDVLQDVQPDFLIILDADEFYCKADQQDVNDRLSKMRTRIRHVCFKFTHIWRPASVLDMALFSYEVVGGFFGMAHAKAHRWSPGLRYSKEHQRPDPPDGESDIMHKMDGPYCLHMAFASDSDLRIAKHRYYVARGEGRGDGRDWYVRSRAMFHNWKQRVCFPNGAKVQPYSGPIPEVFRDDYVAA